MQQDVERLNEQEAARLQAEQDEIAQLKAQQEIEVAAAEEAARLKAEQEEVEISYRSQRNGVMWQPLGLRVGERFPNFEDATQSFPTGAAQMQSQAESEEILGVLHMPEALVHMLECL